MAKSPLIVARDMRSAAIVPGTYLTDGTRLVEVRKMDGARVICEEGAVAYPDILSLSKADVAANWRVVEPAANGAEA